MAQSTLHQPTQPTELAPLGANEGEEAIAELLIDGGQLAETDLQRARRLRDQQAEPEPLLRLLSQLGLVSERDIAATLCQGLGLQAALESDYPETFITPEGVSSAFLEQHQCLVLADEPERLLVAMANPLDRYVVDALGLISARAVEVRVAVPRELEAALERLTEQNQAAQELGDLHYEDDAERLKEMASEAPVVKLVGQLLQRAVEQQASDIHIEPFEEALRIRFRIDGVLREVESRPVAMTSAVISRIKILANLNIAERRLPQDGRFRTRALGSTVDLRISTVPTLHGESVVIRLLNRDDVRLDFDALGFDAGDRERIEGLLAHPHGIILVTGPTGSGKTTTLYAALNQLNDDQRKILTVEDPVEYHLAGINQIQVKPQIGLDFASALRSIVRQDPDVIMVGEMRDRETAEIAVQSALTGHLVLSTLHTNDAVGSITRLLDMGVDDYLLTSTVNGVLAQRLVRRLCEHCKQPYQPSPGLLRRFGALAGTEQGQLYQPRGCEACGGSGFRGRTTIVELLELDASLRDLVLSRADAGKLSEAARARGMRSMFEHGLEKVRAGETCLDEILRVTRAW